MLSLIALVAVPYQLVYFFDETIRLLLPMLLFNDHSQRRDYTTREERLPVYVAIPRLIIYACSSSIVNS